MSTGLRALNLNQPRIIQLERRGQQKPDYGKGHQRSPMFPRSVERLGDKIYIQSSYLYHSQNYNKNLKDKNTFENTFLIALPSPHFSKITEMFCVHNSLIIKLIKYSRNSGIHKIC
uniref:Uncharacterized protein n=1 Tax=Anguilla anguilla TaxID=7936 RepID=A0A0E9X8J5_ANGAN